MDPTPTATVLANTVSAASGSSLEFKDVQALVWGAVIGLVLTAAITVFGNWLSLRNQRILARDDHNHQLFIRANEARRAWREKQAEPLLEFLNGTVVFSDQLRDAALKEDGPRIETIRNEMYDTLQRRGAFLAADPEVSGLAGRMDEFTNLFVKYYGRPADELGDEALKRQLQRDWLAITKDVYAWIEQNIHGT